MHQRKRLSPSRWRRSLATLKKTRSPHTIGVDPENAGKAIFHVTFSVFDQRIGRPCSVLNPFCEGPRHCGQLSATTVADAKPRNVRARQGRNVRNGRKVRQAMTLFAALAASAVFARLITC